MWIIYRFISLFLLAVVNCFDEYLSTSDTNRDSSTIHQRVGALLLASTLFTIFGTVILWFFIEDLSLLSSQSKWIALLSAIPTAATFAGYFYSLNFFSVQLVGPLFLLATIWLALFESVTGTHLTFIALVSMAVILFGTYLLDIGEFRFKIPTKIFLFLVPTTIAWALSVLMVQKATQEMGATTAYFLQLAGMTSIGLILYTFIKPYRQGLAQRIKIQSKTFLGLSFLNESIGQVSYFFYTLAVAQASFVSYLSALEGIQGIFVMILLFLFPINERSKINKIQAFAVVLISAGSFSLLTFG